MSRNRLSMACAFPKQAPGFSFERLNGKRLLPGLAVAWIGNYSPSQNRPGTASVVSRNWLVFRRKEFSFPARRERRAYPSAVCEERARSGRRKGLRLGGLRRKRPGASLL